MGTLAKCSLEHIFVHWVHHKAIVQTVFCLTLNDYVKPITISCILEMSERISRETVRVYVI